MPKAPNPRMLQPLLDDKHVVSHLGLTDGTRFPATSRWSMQLFWIKAQPIGLD
jgi:hypothetical protein